MNRTSAASHLRSRRSIAAGAVLLVAGAFPAARAARADFPLPLPHEIHREVRAHVHDALRTLGRIPAEIHRDHVRNLEVFLGGNVYYAPHRHQHSTYNFPVYVDGGVDYRPYTYCNSRLYGSYASRPQFWAGWGVPSQGRWCSSHRSYYPTGHSCFSGRSRSYDRDRFDPYRSGSRDNRYDRYDRDDRYERHDRRNRYDRHERSYRSERGDRNGRHHRHDRSCGHDRRGRH